MFANAPLFLSLFVSLTFSARSARLAVVFGVGDQHPPLALDQGLSVVKLLAHCGRGAEQHAGYELTIWGAQAERLQLFALFVFFFLRAVLTPRSRPAARQGNVWNRV